jgi:hypothetical protein
VRVSQERRVALLVEFDKAGMSAARFAAWAGINYQMFARWVLRPLLSPRRKPVLLEGPKAFGFENDLLSIDCYGWLIGHNLKALASDSTFFGYPLELGE